MKKLGRVRIPILILVSLLLSVSAFADALPFYTIDGYSTINGFVNLSDAPISIDTDPDSGFGYVGRFRELAPKEEFRRASTRVGFGAEDVATPPGIVAYAEITTPHGAKFRAYPQPAKDAFFVPSLLVSSGYNSGLLIAAATKTTVTVGDTSFLLRPGEARIVGVDTSSVTLTNILPGFPGFSERGTFHVFPFVNVQSNGTIFTVPTY